MAPQLSWPGYFVHLDRRADALDLGRTETLESEIALTKLPDLLRRRDRANRRQRLHPRCQTGGVSNRHILRMRIGGVDGPRMRPGLRTELRSHHLSIAPHSRRIVGPPRSSA